MRVFDIGGPERPYEATDRVVTVPNALSIARLAIVPFVFLDIVGGRFSRAFVLILLMAATDWFDGFLARILDQRTRLGAVLDPIGDRVAFAALGVALVLAELLPVWVVAILLGREIVVLLFGLLLLRSGRGIPATSRLGKVATSGLAASLSALVGAEALTGMGAQGYGALRAAALVGLAVNLILTYVASVGYARAAWTARS